MAKTSNRNTKKVRKAIPNAKTVAKGKALTESSTTTDGELQGPIHAAITTIFQNDANVRQALSANLKGRTTASQALAKQAHEAFIGFSPSKYSTEERARQNYLGPGDDLSQALKTVIANSVESIRASKVKRSIKLRNSSDLKRLIKNGAKGGNASLVGTIKLGILIPYIMQKPNARPSLSSDPVYTSCKAELEAEEKLKKIEGAAGPKDDSKPIVKDAPAEHRTAVQLVQDTVNMQMATATSPEAQLEYSRIPNNANKNEVQSSLLQTFELRPGASDVTSYHDFNSLQIAFENVWTEIFDSQLAGLGQELYHEYIKLKAFNGIDGEDRKISTLNDLTQLLAEIKDFTKITTDSLPSELQTNTDDSRKGGNAGIDIGDVMNKAKDVAPFLIDPAAALAMKIAEWLTGKKPLLTWESFKSPLPSGDYIEVKMEPDAVRPGFVEIVLAAGYPGMWWKAIMFTDNSTSFTQEIWTETGRQQSDSMLLTGTSMKSGTLEFKKAAPHNAVHTGYYLLAGLDSLKPGTRVTFTWRTD